MCIRDSSNKEDYVGFLADYRAIIAQAVERLRPDRFACVVVGDIRDKKGMYRNFVADTIAAFRDAGMALYNEAVLVTAVGSLSIRCLLYTSDAADERSSVDLGGRRIIKKKKRKGDEEGHGTSERETTDTDKTERTTSKPTQNDREKEGRHEERD